MSKDCTNRGNNSVLKWFTGNELRKILVADADIASYVGTNVFPIVAPEDTMGDFIVYQRDNYKKEQCIQGVYEDKVQITLTIISENYDNTVALAQLVDIALVGQHKIENFDCTVMLIDAVEGFEDNKYYQSLSFEIK